MTVIILSLVLLVPLAFVPKGWVLVEAEIAYVEAPKVYLLRILTALAVPCIAILLYDRGLRLNWVTAAVAAFLVWAVMATVFSTDPAISFWGEFYGQDGSSLIATLHYGLVFCAVAVAFNTPERIKTLLTIVALSGAVASMPVILQHFHAMPLDLLPSGVGRPSGTFGNPVFAGSYLGLTAMVTVYLTARERTWYSLFLIPHVGALYILGSRGSLIGLAVFWIVLALYIMWQHADRSNWKLWLGGTLVLMVPALIIGGMAVGNGRIVRSGEEIQGRLTIWQGALTLVGGSPAFGVGPDMFRYRYLQISPPGQRGVPEEPDHAHNWLAHSAAEMGIGGGIVAAGLYGASAAVSGPLAAVFVGRLAEQMVGVARISDLMLFWMLLGVAYQTKVLRS